jgi:exopolysaccharide biosynthesis polyprenyl glycosylphosphotransferase
MVMFPSALRPTTERVGYPQSPWLLITTEQSMTQLCEQFGQSIPQGTLHLLVDLPIRQLAIDTWSYLGGIDELEQLADRAWTGVILDPQVSLTAQQERLLMQYRLNGIRIYPVAEFYETFLAKLPSKLLCDRWFTFSVGFKLHDRELRWWFKRISDFVAAAALLVAVSPLMLIAAIAVHLNSPGPILYSQIRTGHDGKPFRVYKFRSMYQDAESRGAQWAQERDPRITLVGHWLRVSRIDELPQIWNVLRGDMSLIGPRPERPEFDAQLTQAMPYYDVRYRVKPGITGWAQVMYPYGASVEDAYEKLSYDLYYIKNYSIGLELWIVLKTIQVVLLGKGR